MKGDEVEKILWFYEISRFGGSLSERSRRGKLPEDSETDCK